MPGNRAPSQQSRREFTPPLPKARAGDIAIPAHAKFAGIRLNPFVSARSPQSPEKYQWKGSVQDNAKRRASRVARSSRRPGRAVPRTTAMSLHLTDITAKIIRRHTHSFFQLVRDCETRSVAFVTQCRVIANTFARPLLIAQTFCGRIIIRQVDQLRGRQP